jgi:hypothetical protein
MMSCRTAPLRVGRALARLFELSSGQLRWASRCSADDVAGQRPGL